MRWCSDPNRRHGAQQGNRRLITIIKVLRHDLDTSLDFKKNDLWASYSILAATCLLWLLWHEYRHTHRRKYDVQVAPPQLPITAEPGSCHLCFLLIRLRQLFKRFMLTALIICKLPIMLIVMQHGFFQSLFYHTLIGSVCLMHSYFSSILMLLWLKLNIFIYN